VENAGELSERICFKQMDAQQLEFEDESFSLRVTRILTWNWERPDIAYKEWYCVLKPGGILLNFDAGWYEYLFDEEQAKAFRRIAKMSRKAACGTAHPMPMLLGIFSESWYSVAVSGQCRTYRCCRMPASPLETYMEP